MQSRRAFIMSGAPVLAGLILPRNAIAAPNVHTITMESDTLGSAVWFDPIGLHVQAGDTIRWVIRSNVHTVAAYHPDNDHALRIPAAAAPWNSGYLVNPGDAFELTLTEAGVYDYYCEPHEFSGMVGRIVVGPVGEASTDWTDVPAVARRAFPAVAEILAKGEVHISGGNAGEKSR